MKTDLLNRTKNFSILIIDLVEKMDYSITKKIVSNQLTQRSKWIDGNNCFYFKENELKNLQSF